MSTPTSNSVPLDILSSNGLSLPLKALLAWDEDANHDGAKDVLKWGGGWGTGVQLTYSFPGADSNPSTAHYDPNYPGNEWSKWSPFDAAQIAAAKSALSTWAQSADVTFTEVADNAATVGDLRFAMTGTIKAASGEYAHAYSPWSDPAGGDLWFSTAWSRDADSDSAPGTYPYLTLMHEIGHTLGLKHPQDGPYKLDAAHDSYFYSIMSYYVKPGHLISDVGADFYPTTPMYDDLMAIQKLYGQSPDAHPGNTTYTFDGNTHYWQTINDVSGWDRIVYNSTTGGRIDLSGRSFSHLGVPIHFTDGTQSSETVAIGPNTIIESATGGSGNDTIIGTGGHNVLSGRGGNDSILGNGGADTIYGGGGNDKIAGGAGSDVLSGGGGHDSFIYKAVSNSTSTSFDHITDFDANQDRFNFNFAMNAVDQTVKSGHLSTWTFDRDLGNALGAAHLHAHDAVLFRPSSGNERGHAFLVVDANGQAGYQAGQDYVIKLEHSTHLWLLTAHDFT